MERADSVGRGMLLRSLVAALCLAGLLFSAVVPAAAKGVQAVVIDGPMLEAPIQIEMVPENYDLVGVLMEDTGLWFGGADAPRPGTPPPGELGAPLMVTWIVNAPPDAGEEMHEIRQEIYLAAEGGALVHTPPQAYLQGWAPNLVGWYEPPSSLQATLAEAGVPVEVVEGWEPKGEGATDAGLLAGFRLAAGDLPLLPVGAFAVVVAASAALGVGWLVREHRRRAAAD